MITVHHYEPRDGIEVCKYCGAVRDKDAKGPRWCPRVAPRIRTREAERIYADGLRQGYREGYGDALQGKDMDPMMIKEDE